jgi:hypothetical protein
MMKFIYKNYFKILIYCINKKKICDFYNNYKTIPKLMICSLKKSIKYCSLWISHPFSVPKDVLNSDKIAEKVAYHKAVLATKLITKI